MNRGRFVYMSCSMNRTVVAKHQHHGCSGKVPIWYDVMQARHQRVKAKAQQARAARQAATLRKFWHTQSGVTWQDALLFTLFTGSMLGLGYYWTPKASPKLTTEES